MDLKNFGWEEYSRTLKENIEKENVARVAIENRGGYLLYSEFGEIEGILQGKFLRSAKKESDYPKVGDWVEIEKLSGEPKAIIKTILPRLAKISRKRAGEQIEEQIIAANIDLVFIVQGLDGDFNLSRLQRYVSMAKEGNCQPIILLNKADLANDREGKRKEVLENLNGIKVFLISAKTGEGIEEIRMLIKPGLSVVFVGSSGVGKSTLVNALLGIDLQKTQEVRPDDDKGKHTTTKRELFILPAGGLLIDTPGMRELGLWASADSVTETFEDIRLIAEDCKFRDCDHVSSAGCAVLRAVALKKISADRYGDFIKLFGGLDHKKEKVRRNSNAEQKRRLQSVIKSKYFEKK